MSKERRISFFVIFFLLSHLLKLISKLTQFKPQSSSLLATAAKNRTFIGFFQKIRKFSFSITPYRCNGYEKTEPEKFFFWQKMQKNACIFHSFSTIYLTVLVLECWMPI